MSRLPSDLLEVAALNPVPHDVVVGERTSAQARELRERLLASAATEGESRRRHGRIATKRALLLAATGLLVPAGAVGGIVGWSVFAPTQGQLEAEQGGTFVPGSLRVLRTLERPGGVTWTVVTYKTTKYECLDVYGRTTGSVKPAGAVGGCGLPRFSQEMIIQGLGAGGLTVGSDFFSVAEGRAAPEVVTVRATFADGGTTLDHPEGGVWLFVERGDRSPNLVEALDRGGNVLARLPLTIGDVAVFGVARQLR
jgi:hypothetical protein